MLSENASPRFSTLLLPAAAAWLGLALLHGALQLAAPRAAATDSLLPWWARLSLLATEGAALAVAVAAFAGLFRALAAARSRLSPALAPAFVAARSLPVSLFLLALSASWSSFWLSGQFLDRAGLAFTAANLRSVLSYAARTHPLLLYGLPGLLLAFSVGVVEGFPRFSRGLPIEAGRAVARVAAGAVGLCVASAAAGEVGHHFSQGKVSDPSNGSIYSRGELYRLRRNRNSGPLTHVVSTWFEPSDPFDDDPGREPPPVLRRPIQPMDRYLGGADPQRLHRWNVIVVLIDSLRADQLRACGGSRDVMPGLDALAREGVVFRDCTTPASHTDYAAPAVFSKTLPVVASTPTSRQCLPRRISKE